MASLRWVLLCSTALRSHPPLSVRSARLAKRCAEHSPLGATMTSRDCAASRMRARLAGCRESRQSFCLVPAAARRLTSTHAPDWIDITQAYSLSRATRAGHDTRAHPLSWAPHPPSSAAEDPPPSRRMCRPRNAVASPLLPAPTTLSRVRDAKCNQSSIPSSEAICARRRRTGRERYYRRYAPGEALAVCAR